MTQIIPAQFNGVDKSIVQSIIDDAKRYKLFNDRKDLYRSPSGFSSWKYVLARLIAHGKPFMAPLALMATDPICPTVWRTNRNALMSQAPVRYISRELCDSFQKTPIPPLSDEMLRVYPSLIIMLPSGSLIGDHGENIDFLTVESNLGDDIFFTKEERDAFVTCSSIKPAPYLVKAAPPGFFVSASSYYVDYTWVGYLNGSDAGRQNLSAETRSVVDRIGRIAISSILTHLYEPELITAETLRRPGRGFGAAPATELPVTWIGRNFRYSRPEQRQPASLDGPPGPCKRPHWRRGHWHTVACGEGRQERRMTWFRPVFVNGSL